MGESGAVTRSLEQDKECVLLSCPLKNQPLLTLFINSFEKISHRPNARGCVDCPTAATGATTWLNKWSTTIQHDLFLAGAPR